MKTSLLLLLLVIGSVAVVDTGPQNPSIIAHPRKELYERTVIPRAVPRMYGGLNPIGNIDDPLIQEIGEWAVSEHVKRTNYGLMFGKVVSGEEQVVAGMKYYLVIRTLNVRGKIGTYKAVVFDQQWTNTRKLTSFVPAN